jgi:hypothetical protein
MFVKKNYLDDLWLGSKFLYSLIKFIDMDANLEDKLEKFEGVF